MAHKAISEKDGYQVNIELKDQLNNVFYIDNVNDDNSIMLKDFSFEDDGIPDGLNIHDVVTGRGMHFRQI